MQALEDGEFKEIATSISFLSRSSSTYPDAKVTCTPTFDMHNKTAIYNITKCTLSQNTSFFILLVRIIALVCGSFYYDDSVIVLCRDIKPLTKQKPLV